VIFFESDNCPYCREMEPAIHRLAAEGFDCRRVNVSRDQNAGTAWGIQMVPCFVFLNGDVETERYVGKTSFDALRNKLRKPGPAKNHPQPKEAPGVVGSQNPQPTPPKTSDGNPKEIVFDEDDPTEPTAGKEKKPPLLPWREKTESHDEAQDARIRALIELQERQARTAAAERQHAVDVSIDSSKKSAEAQKTPQEKSSPLAAGVCILGAIGLATAFYYMAAKSK
jgi:thiol-disulfide isomerase/thioredoxin